MTIRPKAKPELKQTRLEVSSLKVFDVPDDLIDEHDQNPNIQDDTTFDVLCQKIRDDGFDEPLLLVPNMKKPGRYLIFSGHHRRRAGKVIGMTKFPGIIKHGWDEDKADMELVSRNMLRGKLNPEKFTALYDKLKLKGYDDALIRAQMGFTKTDAFEKLYKQVEAAVPKEARKKLADAKETITSVDGLSSTLNNIFREHGADLEHGFIVFNFANKTHHHVPCDKELNKLMEQIEERCRNDGINISDVFKELLGSGGARTAGTRSSLRRAAPENASSKRLLRPTPASVNGAGTAGTTVS